MKFVSYIQNDPCRVPGDVRSMPKERNQLCYLTRSTLYLNIKVYPNHVCTLKENVAQVSSFYKESLPLSKASHIKQVMTVVESAHAFAINIWRLLVKGIYRGGK